MGDASGAYLLHSVPGPSGPRRFCVVSVGPQTLQVKGVEASTASAWYTKPRHCRVFSEEHVGGESVQRVGTAGLQATCQIDGKPSQWSGEGSRVSYVPLLYVGQHSSRRCGDV